MWCVCSCWWHICCSFCTRESIAIYYRHGRKMTAKKEREKSRLANAVLVFGCWQKHQIADLQHGMSRLTKCAAKLTAGGNANDNIIDNGTRDEWRATIATDWKNCMQFHWWSSSELIFMLFMLTPNWPKNSPLQIDRTKDETEEKWNKRKSE